MENQKSIAMIIAAIAGILVVVAGKSCASDLESGKNSSSSPEKQQVNISISTDLSINAGNNSNADSDVQPQATELYTDPDVQYVTDLLGRVIGTVAPEDVTHTEIEYVTDLLGRVVRTEVHIVDPSTTEAPTHIEYVTDLLGRVVGTEYVDGPAPSTEAPSERPTQTTTRYVPKGTVPGTIYITID